MRRSLLLVGSLAFTLGACGGDAFTAHPDIAAEAAGQELPATRVAEILTSVKGVQVSPEAARFVASLWVDYTLFAQAVAEGSLESDSTTIADAMWTDVAELTAGHFFDSLIARRAQVTPEKVDSAYKAGDIRVLQHVLITVDPSATEAERRTARQKADRIHDQAVGGADFGKLALDNSGDVSTKVDSGFLPPSPKGAFVPAFDSAAWLLEPGQVSDVVVTSYGFHVIRRASEAQAKARIEQWLPNPLISAMEKGYFEQLDSTRNVKLVKNAPARAKEVLADLAKAGKSDRALITYDGGEITEADFAKWVRAMTADPVQGPQALEQMKQLPDSVVETALTQVAQRYLFLQQAKDEGIGITPEDWQQVKSSFDASVDTLKTEIGLGPDVIDPNAPEADRRKAAAMRVDQFFDRMTQGQSRMRLLPGMLTWTLRQHAEGRVNPAGVQQAVSLAQAQISARDSAATGDTTAGVAPSPIKPAPGGPPVPGGDGQ